MVMSFGRSKGSCRRELPHLSKTEQWPSPWTVPVSLGNHIFVGISFNNSSWLIRRYLLLHDTYSMSRAFIISSLYLRTAPFGI